MRVLDPGRFKARGRTGSVYLVALIRQTVKSRRANRRLVWSWREELNLQPAVYKTAALPLSYASPFMISPSYLLSPLCCPVKCFGLVHVKVLSLPIRRLCQVSLLDVIVSLPHLRERVPHNLHSRGGVHTRTSQVGCGTVSQGMEPKPTISLSHVLVPSRPPVYNTGSIWPLSLLRLPCPSPFVPTVASLGRVSHLLRA